MKPAARYLRVRTAKGTAWHPFTDGAQLRRVLRRLRRRLGLPPEAVLDLTTDTNSPKEQAA